MAEIIKAKEIRQMDLRKVRKASEYTVFDAIRDNQGSGVKARDLIDILNAIE